MMKLPEGLSVKAILNFIPEEALDKIGEATQVDRHVKKLSGKSLFKLFLFSFIGSERASLRVLEHCYQEQLYQTLTKEKNKKTKHTSLSDRLKTINVDYFEELFGYLVRRLKPLSENKEAKKILRFDSTLVTLSSKLFKRGMPIAKGVKNQVKITVGFSGLPNQVKIFVEKKEAGSEEIALKEAIKDCSESREGIVVFDRGLNSRKTYDEFDQESIQFVSRLKDNARYKKVKDVSQIKGKRCGSLCLEEDMEVQLAAKGTRWLEPTFRLITGVSEDSQKKWMFVTNIGAEEMSAEEITEIYRQRWDIEVFFRFIKQELHAKHLLSRDLNGIKVVMYMIMILASMLLIYKLSNGLSGYKIVKLKFMSELEMELIKELIVYCGGDPKKLKSKIPITLQSLGITAF